MYSRLKRLYQEKRITKEQLYKAVENNWITIQEYNEIVKEE